MKMGKGGTKRWIGSSPNLQNIPIRTPEGTVIKTSLGLYEMHFFDSGDCNEINRTAVSKSRDSVFKKM